MAHKKCDIKTVIIIILSVATVALICVLALEKLPQWRLSMASEGSVIDGTLTNVEESLHITNVPEGEIRYLINKDMSFDKYYALGDVMIENPESCKYTIQFKIYTQNGTLIYTSPMIEPGQCLDRDKLSVYTAPGQYNCTYAAFAYQNGELKGEVDGVLSVKVGS